MADKKRRSRSGGKFDDSPKEKCKKSSLHCYIEQIERNGDLEHIKRGLNKLCTHKHFSLMALEILNCDAGCDVGVSFSHAHCETEIKTDEFYPFASIFMKGVETLVKVLQDKDYIPEDDKIADAVERLLQYFSDEGRENVFINLLKKTGYTRNEMRLSVALSEHVFSKLATSGYLLDNHNAPKDYTCMCGCNVNVASKSGNTSIGNPQTWHGYIDILVAGVPIAVESGDSISPGDRTPVEVEYETKIDSFATKQQILAQSIVFSFLQKIRHPELDNFLIPSIGVSIQEIMFLFYDCVNDILLQTQPFDLTMYDTYHTAVIAIWFVLNYKCLCSGLSENLKLAPKAKFFKLAKKKLQIFEKGLSFGDVNNGYDPRTPNPSLVDGAKFSPLVIDDW